MVFAIAMRNAHAVARQRVRAAARGVLEKFARICDGCLKGNRSGLRPAPQSNLAKIPE